MCVDITSTSASTCDWMHPLLWSTHHHVQAFIWSMWQFIHVGFVSRKGGRPEPSVWTSGGYSWTHGWTYSMSNHWGDKVFGQTLVDIQFVLHLCGRSVSNQDGHTVCPGWTIGLSILNTGALCYNCVDKLYVHLILVPGHFKVWTKKLVGHIDDWTIKVGASSHTTKRMWTLYLRIVPVYIYALIVLDNSSNGKKYIVWNKKMVENFS